MRSSGTTPGCALIVTAWAWVTVLRTVSGHPLNPETTVNTDDSDQNSTQNQNQNSGDTTNPTTTTKRRVAPLLARRRQNLPRDAHIAEDKVTHTDENGDKIHRVKIEKDSGEVETTDTNLTKLLGAAPSTSSNMELLEIEAKQAAEATDEERARMNPHIPSSDAVLRAILDHLRPMDLTPAWEVIGDA